MPWTPAPPMDVATFAEYVQRFAWTRRVDEVHMHHTWEPNRATWAGARSIIAMRDYHMNVNGWSDIGQHLTIAPDGGLWLGRDWNRPPASSAGHNGTSALGPFMFETVGNFDRGHERLDGAQRAAVYGVIATIQRHFGLPAETLRFHRQLGSPKTCPGSGIDYAAFLTEVKAYRLGCP